MGSPAANISFILILDEFCSKRTLLYQSLTSDQFIRASLELGLSIELSDEPLAVLGRVTSSGTDLPAHHVPFSAKSPRSRVFASSSGNGFCSTISSFDFSDVYRLIIVLSLAALATGGLVVKKDELRQSTLAKQALI